MQGFAFHEMLLATAKSEFFNLSKYGISKL